MWYPSCAAGIRLWPGRMQSTGARTVTRSMRRGLRGVDAVVHLAGEPLVQLPRWTEEKKRRILESRVRGTELIARRRGRPS